ncbi:unnamed protein product [Musa hybrid cultivar]
MLLFPETCHYEYAFNLASSFPILFHLLAYKGRLHHTRSAINLTTNHVLGDQNHQDRAHLFIHSFIHVSPLWVETELVRSGTSFAQLSLLLQIGIDGTPMATTIGHI